MTPEMIALLLQGLESVPSLIKAYQGVRSELSETDQTKADASLASAFALMDADVDRTEADLKAAGQA